MHVQDTGNPSSPMSIVHYDIHKKIRTLNLQTFPKTPNCITYMYCKNCATFQSFVMQNQTSNFPTLIFVLYNRTLKKGPVFFKAMQISLKAQIAMHTKFRKNSFSQKLVRKDFQILFKNPAFVVNVE